MMKNDANNPMVSVIICTRNRGEALRRGLDWLGRVRVPADLPTECSVVDNGSTDGTAQLVRSVTLPNMPLRYLTEGRRGKARAMNTGLTAGAGRVILFTDDDVELPENWLEGMARPILNGQVDAMAGGVRVAPDLQLPWVHSLHRCCLASTEYLDPKGPSQMIGANMAIGRHVLTKVPCFDPELGTGALGGHEDSLFSWQLLRAGFRIGTALGVCAVHHADQDRLTRTSLLHHAQTTGQSDAYIAYHWEHLQRKDIRAPWTYYLGRRVMLVYRRLRRPTLYERRPGVSHVEYEEVRRIGFARQMVIERRRPRNYDQYGLVKLHGEMGVNHRPPAATKDAVSPANSTTTGREG